MCRHANFSPIPAIKNVHLCEEPITTVLAGSVAVAAGAHRASKHQQADGAKDVG
jgi:hypothetical protein